jgi:chromosome segregation ATPase
VPSDVDTVEVLRCRVGVLRAELAGVTGRLRGLEATLAERDAEAAHLRQWAEGAEHHAVSEQAGREATQTAREREVADLTERLEEAQRQLAVLSHSAPVRISRALKRVARMGR